VGRSWLADRPVRCPNEAPPGSFCGFTNYHKLLESKSNPPPNNQRSGQGNWRGRGQGFRPWRGGGNTKGRADNFVLFIKQD
jgi:hypothetical protein